MLKSVTLENFFSFGKSTTIELNERVSINVGINGSGKSNFLKAIRLLYEGLWGVKGLEHLFLSDWGGFDSVANYSSETSDVIFLRFCFEAADLDHIEATEAPKLFSEVVYEVTIKRRGNVSYSLTEHLYQHQPNGDNSQLTYLYASNNQDIRLKFNDTRFTEAIQTQIIKSHDYNSHELVLRQTDQNILPFIVMSLKAWITKFSVYEYFDTTKSSPIRKLTGYSQEARLSRVQRRFDVNKSCSTPSVYWCLRFP